MNALSTILFRRSGAPARLLAAAGLVAVLCLLAARAWAAPGDLNRSFSGDGIATVGSDSRLFAGTVQPDGKLVAVGDQGNFGGNPHALVVRFTTGGALDRTFSGDGMFTGAAGTTARAVAMQGTKIVVAGSLINGNGGMLALRLNPNGGPDRTFSGDGAATTFTDSAGVGRAVAVQGAKVLLGGGARLASDGFERVALARFNGNGSPDGSFGSGGTRLYEGFGRLSFANALALDAQGRILLAGSSTDNLQSTNLIAARLKANGDQDSSFGGNAGIAGLFAKDYARNAGFAAAYDLVVDARGRPVIAGAATNGSSDPEGSDAIAVRLTTGGAPDNSFSGDGIAYLPATSNKDTFNKTEPFPGAHGLAVSGANYILGGYFDTLGGKHAAIWALTQGGAPVAGFGSGGRVVTDSAGGPLNDVAAAAGGAIYGVGTTINLFGPPQGFALAHAGFPTPVQLTVKVKRSFDLGAALRRGIPVRMTCNQPCTLAAVLKALGSVVAKAKGKLATAGSKVLKLRFTPAGKRKLAGKDRAAAKLIATAKAGGKTDKVTKGIVLK